MLVSTLTMDTAGEIRRQRLKWLLETREMSQADLNRALGRQPRDSTISQILAGAKDSKTGKTRQMGDIQARAIEQALTLPHGIMDAPMPLDPNVQPLPVRKPADLGEALQVLAAALARADQDTRDAAAPLLAGLARDGGADRWRRSLLGLLDTHSNGHTPGQTRRAA
jgi:hypothetical protein